MKIEQKLKIIYYFWNDLVMPAGVAWVATDENGNVNGFREGDKPYACRDRISWLCDNGALHLGIADLDGMDWKETLMEVDR